MEERSNVPMPSLLDEDDHPQMLDFKSIDHTCQTAPGLKIESVDKDPMPYRTIVYYDDEIFMPYPKNTRYWIGHKGTIYDSLIGMKILPFREPDGNNRKTSNLDQYAYIDDHNYIERKIGVHELVAETFVEKPQRTVVHIDGNRTNNKSDNLVWW